MWSGGPVEVIGLVRRGPRRLLLRLARRVGKGGAKTAPAVSGASRRRWGTIEGLLLGREQENAVKNRRALSISVEANAAPFYTN